MSNYNGGSSEARLVFLQELQEDPDFIQYKKNARKYILKKEGELEDVVLKYGVIHVAEDPFVRDSEISKIIKKYATRK